MSRDAARRPEPPAGYVLVGFEVVRTRPGPGESFHEGRRVFPQGEESDGLRLALLHRRPGDRLAALAWFDGPLDGCPHGRERLVADLDPATGRWSPWCPRERVGDAGGDRERRGGRPVVRWDASRRFARRGFSGTDLGDGVQS